MPLALRARCDGITRAWLRAHCVMHMTCTPTRYALVVTLVAYLRVWKCEEEAQVKFLDLRPEVTTPRGDLRSGCVIQVYIVEPQSPGRVTWVKVFALGLPYKT